MWSGILDSGILAGIPEGRIRNTYVLVGLYYEGSVTSASATIPYDTMPRETNIQLAD